MKWTLILLMVAGFVAVLASAQDAIGDDEANELAAGDEQESDNSGAEDATSAEDEDDDQVNVRVARAANNGKQKKEKKGGKPCRYEKGPWSECDKATNKRTRSLTLKKGDSSCEQTKTKTKPCKNNKDKKRGRN